MINNKKVLLLISLFSFMQTVQAEVLVILPETGPLARAASSVKQGFMSAYEASGSQEQLKFVNSYGQKMKSLFAKHIKPKTRLVVGPLSREKVEEAIRLNPKVQVLALNEIGQHHNKVLQFSLSKNADAATMAALMLRDNIRQVSVLREPGIEADSEIFLIALMSQLDYPVQIIEVLPKKLPKQQALLLLGKTDWLNSIVKLPKTGIYAHAIAIEEGAKIPEGLKFCDAPALYEAKWPEMIIAYQQQPVNMAYQRLLAFGGDAWTLAEHYLQQPKNIPIGDFSFEGRTGQIRVESRQIKRTPQCYQQVQGKLQRITL